MRVGRSDVTRGRELERIRSIATGGSDVERVRSGTTRVCVVGAGRMGTLHARTVAGLAARGGDARVVSVVDRHPARAGALARELGARAGDDAAALFAGCDAAIVAVPTADHVALARAALEAGLDVLVEKPLALDAASGRSLVDRARALGRILQVGHVEWYEPAWRAAVRRVGPVRRITVERLNPPVDRGLDIDVVQDFMLHDLDWTTRWSGSDVISLEATGRRVRNASLDEAEARLELTSGVALALRASRVHRERRRRARIEGRDGTALVDLLHHVVRLADGSPVEVPPADPLACQWRAFLEACRTRVPPENDGRVGVAVLELIERVRAVLRVGGPAGACVPAVDPDPEGEGHDDGPDLRG